MPNWLGIGMGYGTFAALLIVIGCLWGMPL